MFDSIEQRLEIDGVSIFYNSSWGNYIVSRCLYIEIMLFLKQKVQ